MRHVYGVRGQRTAAERAQIDIHHAMLAAAEAPPDEYADDHADVSAQSEPPDPHEAALVMRWLVQAWARLEIARVPPLDEPPTVR